MTLPPWKDGSAELAVSSPRSVLTSPGHRGVHLSWSYLMRRKLPHSCDKQVVTSLNEPPPSTKLPREIGTVSFPRFTLHRGDSSLSEKEFLP